MSRQRRVFLNPCDYLLYSDHLIRIRRGQGPNIAYMCMDIDGSLDPERMRNSIVRAMAFSPTTLARLRISAFGGWPFWKLPSDLEAAANKAVEKAYHFVNVRESGIDLNTALATTGEFPTDFRDGPQICMTHYAIDRNRSRLCIRWPHWLMDAAGTLSFLALWARCYEECGDVAPPIPTDSADIRQWKPLAGVSLRHRWRQIRSQSKPANPKSLKVCTPPNEATGPVLEHRVLHRRWDAPQMEQIRVAAKRDMPAAPARITRYLAVCVLQAMDALFKSQGREGDAYRITLPMRMRSQTAETPPSDLRFGNYLVSPLIVIDRRDVGDPSRLADDLTRQVHDYQEAHGDVAQWSLMSLAANLPYVAHRWIFGLPTCTSHFSSGFSFYGEMHPPLRSIAGMPISNLWGGGPTTIPPGMNPVFSRFDHSLNLALTYSWPVVSDDQAAQYLDLIEERVLQNAPHRTAAVRTRQDNTIHRS